MSSLNFFLSFKDKFNWLSFFPTIAGLPCFPIIILDLNKWISSTKLLFNNSVKKIPPASTNKSDIFNEYILLKIKYLGKLNKIINQLENQKIILKFQKIWGYQVLFILIN